MVSTDVWSVLVSVFRVSNRRSYTARYNYCNLVCGVTLMSVVLVAGACRVACALGASGVYSVYLQPGHPLRAFRHVCRPRPLSRDYCTAAARSRTNGIARSALFLARSLSSCAHACALGLGAQCAPAVLHPALDHCGHCPPRHTQLHTINYQPCLFHFTLVQSRRLKPAQSPIALFQAESNSGSRSTPRPIDFARPGVSDTSTPTRRGCR